jgi:hypothetical protein
MNGDTIRTITIRGQSEGLDKLTADVNKLAAAQQNVAVVSEQSAKRVLSLEDAWKRQTLRLDEAARAQANIARETKVADAALREGLATQAQHAQRLDQINQRYAAMAPPIKVVTQHIGLARHEMVNMSRQIQDVGVSLASGQSPFTVLVQQGAQIADIFATTSGTVVGFFRQAGSWAMGFARSMAGVATATAAAGAAWVIAGAQYSSGQNDIERALAGMGAASGVTAKQINEIASASSSAFGLSTSEARTAATAFAATGRIYQDNIKTATGAVSDFAKATGTDAATATKTLAEAMVDPAKGALELNKQFNFLDATQLTYIRTLQASGKEQEAQKALMDALNPKLQKMAEHTSALGKAYDLAANAASNFWQYAGKAAPLGPSIPAPWEDSPKETANKDRLKLMSTDADAAARSIVGVTAQIEALQGQLAKLSQYREAISGPMTAAETIGNVRLQQLQEQEQVLYRQAIATQQLAALYPGMSFEVAKQLDLMNQQLQVAQARSPAEAAIIQFIVDQNRYENEGKGIIEAINLALANRANTEAGVTKAINDQLWAMNQEIELSKARVAGTEAATRAEQAYANAKRQGATEDQSREMQRTTSRLADQQAAEKNANDLDAANRSRVAGEKSAAAAGEAAKERSRAQQEAWQQSEDAARRAQSAYQTATGIGSDGMFHFGWQIAHVTTRTYQLIDAFQEFSSWWASHSKEWMIDNRLWHMATQFQGEDYVSTYDPLNTQVTKTGLESAVGADNVESFFQSTGPGMGYTDYRIKQSYLDQQSKDQFDQMVNSMNVGSPGGIQAGLQKLLSGGTADMTAVNRLIDIADPSQQTSLIQQTIDYIRQTEPPGLATEEKVRTLNQKLEQLANSTDSLNATMQSALSPFYSQDPRTTKIGFRAGVTGNPDWMTGATNANPLVAVLGAGATAPGMAGGGSFTVGGGYSANDNRMAVFPVASGEEVVVNRNRDGGGRGGQVVHIDNRIIIAGSVDADALSKMKVSRYQQAQRMRGQIAQA